MESSWPPFIDHYESAQTSEEKTAAGSSKADGVRPAKECFQRRARHDSKVDLRNLTAENTVAKLVKSGISRFDFTDNSVLLIANTVGSPITCRLLLTWRLDISVKMIEVSQETRYGKSFPQDLVGCRRVSTLPRSLSQRAIATAERVLPLTDR